MSYQALARKWRPKSFAELVGQEHVVTALSNALTRGRLHHAYLLTGTRGVGKTTIARILAKSLNCGTGVTATPCGVCAACTDVDAGRFVDLLELDAASNTGVDNMRDILDNARYAPTVGRYKVYLIDEVHMLSKGAFNSMLKTLEEPPEHVKFVLATTDPQKIPVTVLSRCLQFNLKPLAPREVADRIESILEAESIAHESGAVALVARAARGSLRDGLSLLDQAIAYGGGEVREEVVRRMLGAVDRDHVYRIADALAAGDGVRLLAESDLLAVRGLSAASALEELASLFHRIAVAQAVPDAAQHADDADQVRTYASRFTPEAVQLAYQICAQGRADLAIAPDEAIGFSMTLLRLLAFEPAVDGHNAAAAGSPAVAFPRGRSSAAAAGRETQGAVHPAAASAARQDRRTPGKDHAGAQGSETWSAESHPERSSAGSKPTEAPSSSVSIDSVSIDSASAPAPAETTRSAETPAPEQGATTVSFPSDPSGWPDFVATLKLAGLAAQLAAHTELRGVKGHVVNLSLPAVHKHLADRAYSDKLKAALERATGRKLMLAFEVGENTPSSLAAQVRRERDEAKQRTEAAFRDEPFVRDLVERFDGKVRPDSIKPPG